jgi:hypothetical protein
VWDIIDEILRLCLPAAPSNPFAVDHDFFNTLSLQASYLLTGALLDFLVRVYARSPVYAGEGGHDVDEFVYIAMHTLFIIHALLGRLPYFIYEDEYKHIAKHAYCTLFWPITLLYL